MAMFDARELALAIVRHPHHFEKAIEEYEDMMYEYSSKKANESENSLKLCFSKDAAVKLADMMILFKRMMIDAQFTILL